MRVFNRFTLTIVTALLAVSCDDETPPASPTLESISLSGDYQTSFKVDDVFTHAGLVVTAHYSDQSSKEVDGYSVSTPDMTSVGDKEVVVTYLTKTKNYTIHVSEDSSQSATLVSISISDTLQTNFTVGDTFTYSGLVVTAHYDDGSSKEVTGFTVSTPDMSSSGTKEITVSYLGVNTTYEINVKPVSETKTLSSISISEPVTSYSVGNSFIKPTVTAHYSDLSTTDVTSKASFSGYDMTKAGNYTVTVSYTEGVTKTASYSITVKAVEKTLSSIAVSNPKGSYEVGDEFVKPVVTATYSDGSTGDVTESATFTGYDLSVAGDYKVTVTYSLNYVTKTTSYNITVSPKSVDPEEEDVYDGYIALDVYRVEIDIVKNPKKTVYLNPRVIKDGKIDSTKADFNCTVDVEGLIKVNQYSGTIKPIKDSTGYQNTGDCVVTVVCEDAPGLKATCRVKLDRNIPEKQKVWNRVDDYDSLSSGDILVMASPEDGVVASLDTLHSKLNPVGATFSSGNKTISSLEEGAIEFYLSIESEGMTLEAQTGEYLVCTHQGKVKLDGGKNTNKYWDIHSNVDIEDGTGSIEDGAVIENNVESLGYMMFNVSLRYFTTYVENSISKYMRLPFLYRFEELD